MNDKDLFDTSECMGHATTAMPPFQPGSATSEAAAEKFKPIAGAMTRKVLEAFAEFGAMGATRDRVHVYHRIPIPTVTSRANRLVDIGALEPTGVTGQTTSGYPAEVLRITEAGGAMLAMGGD